MVALKSLKKKREKWDVSLISSESESSFLTVCITFNTEYFIYGGKMKEGFLIVKS